MNNGIGFGVETQTYTKEPMTTYYSSKKSIPRKTCDKGIERGKEYVRLMLGHKIYARLFSKAITKVAPKPLRENDHTSVKNFQWISLRNPYC